MVSNCSISARSLPARPSWPGTPARGRLPRQPRELHRDLLIRGRPAAEETVQRGDVRVVATQSHQHVALTDRAAVGGVVRTPGAQPRLDPRVALAHDGRTDVAVAWMQVPGRVAGWDARSAEERDGEMA